jgi:hypothetical protein
MIKPADAGATFSASLIKFSTGAIVEPAITVKVAQASMIHRANLARVSMTIHLINFLQQQTRFCHGELD